MRLRLIIGSLALLALVGCGGSSSSTTSTTSVASSVPATSPSTAAPATTTTVKATTTTVKARNGGAMPSVVGMNLQDAQDLIQEKTDVFFSSSFDCTGMGRSQIVDSNWVVVTQTPAPGTPIGEGDAKLGVVKIGETRVC